MSPQDSTSDGSRLDRIVDEVRRERDRKAGTYRDRALKMFPHICGRCGREFSGKKLKELTVHHKDHDHYHNPPDGGNWELLCIYCHDMEHQRYLNDEVYGEAGEDSGGERLSLHRPFAVLETLLKNKK